MLFIVQLYMFFNKYYTLTIMIFYHDIYFEMAQYQKEVINRDVLNTKMLANSFIIHLVVLTCSFFR